MGLRGIGALTQAKRDAAMERALNSGPLPWEAPGLSRAEAVIVFCETLTVTSGLFAGTSLQLRPWQCAFIYRVYREEEDGTRPVRTAVLSMGRKGGKTQLAAALALAHLCGPEAESRGEVYSCATNRFQATKIFDEMVALIDKSPWLAARTNITRFVKKIEDLENGSTYNALTSEARSKHGLSPSFVVYDELGQAPDRELYDAMNTALGARKAPLLLIISTQAANDHAPLSQLIDYGKKVQQGDIEDPSFHLTLFAAPEDCDPWARESWEMANPALGDFRSLEDVERQASQAKLMPSLEGNFRNYVLNQRVAAEDRFITHEQWMKCAGKVVIPDGAKVFAALDLGSTRDLTALVLVHQDDNDVFHVQSYFWLAGDLVLRGHQDHAPYDDWRHAGYLEAAGDATDPAVIALAIAELSAQYRIVTLTFDEWRFAEVKRELDAIGCEIELLPHRMGYKSMSAPIDQLERLIAQKRLRHGDHPVLKMCALNAVVTRDAANNRKLDKSRSSGRIDGLQALAMSLTPMLVQKPDIDVSALIG
jgi:phage terminase large subunit-like protein